MRWIAGIMVWISLIGSLALLGFCTTIINYLIYYQLNNINFTGVYYTSERYVYYKDHPTEHEFAKNYLQSIIKTQEFWLTLLIICSIVLIILLLILLVLRKRIRLAIALIEEGSKYVRRVFHFKKNFFCNIFVFVLERSVRRHRRYFSR